MKVTFLIEPEGSVFAYFPDEFWDNQNNRTAYAHIGQHSACSPEYAKECKPATLDQYIDLLNELKSIGYEDLQVTNPKEYFYSKLSMYKKAYKQARTQKGKQSAMNRAMLNLCHEDQIKFLRWQIRQMKQNENINF